MEIRISAPTYDRAMKDKKAALAYLKSKKKGAKKKRVEMPPCDRAMKDKDAAINYLNKKRRKEQKRDIYWFEKLQKGKKCKIFNKAKSEWENGFISAVVESKVVGTLLYAIKLDSGRRRFCVYDSKDLKILTEEVNPKVL